MTGAELIAIISVSATAMVSLITALFHGSSLSRCSKITCCCCEIERAVLSEDVYSETTRRDTEAAAQQS
jgi:hypothetical protein